MLKDNNTRGYRPLGQLGILIGLLGAGMLVASLATLGVLFLFGYSPMAGLNPDSLSAKDFPVLATIQAVSTILVMLLPTIYFSKICYKSSSRFLGTNTNVSGRQIILLILILFLAFVLNGSLAELNQAIPIPNSWKIRFKEMEESRKGMENVFLNMNSFGRYLVTMLIVGLLAALVEEFFFRGALQNVLIRWFQNPIVGIIASGFIFSIIHLSYYGFLVRFALGIILGYIYYFSGSIWLSVLFHFLFNGIQVTALYVLNLRGTVKPEDIDGNVPMWVALPVIIGIIYLFKLYQEESDKIPQKFEYIEPDPDNISDWIAHHE